MIKKIDKMLFFTIIVCLVTNLCFIKCEGNKKMIVTQKKNDTLCVMEPHYKFTDGDNVSIEIMNLMGLNFLNGTLAINDQITVLTMNKQFEFNVSINQTGLWTFDFMYECYANLHNMRYRRYKCLYSTCTTNVTIVDRVPHVPTPVEMPLLWILLPVAIIAVLIMIAQTFCILHYKSKAQALAPHKHLTKVKLETSDNDDRYCSSPRHKLKKDPPCEINRDSEIYEEPNINLDLASPPPVPSTPRPMDRGCSTMRLLPPSSTTSTLLSTVSANSTFPRRIPVDQDTLTKEAMARRGRHPSPQREIYSETTEEDVYEQPPTPEPPPPAKPMMAPLPMKKPITPGPKPFGGKQLPEFPMGGLKPWNGQPVMNKPVKPPVSQAKPLPPRNNVMQVPILQIPGPSSLKKTPAVASKPIKKPEPKPPLPPPNPKPAFIKDYPQHTDSSDEEWTYEELPKYNIYSS